MPPAPSRTGSHGRDYLSIAAWNRLVDAFRLKPGQCYSAASAAGVNYRTAQKAWRAGLKVRTEANKLVLKPPIADVVEAQQVGARAAREAVRAPTPAPGQSAATPASGAAVALAIGAGQVATAEVRELAERDAIAALAEEARLVRVGRANVSGLMASMSNVVRGALVTSARVQDALERFGESTVLGPDGKPVKTPLSGDQLDQAVNLMGKVVVMLKLTTECVRHVQTAERLLVGEPAGGKTPAGAPGVVTEATVEEARDELARLTPFMQKHGLLRVIEGGKGKVEPEQPAPAEGATG